MVRRNKAVALISAVLCLSPAVAAADEPTTLKEIMQGLRNSLAEIADGLLTDDFGQIGRGASDIAEHPRIPADQVQLIARELGNEMPAFKHFDHNVHGLSLDIKAAAESLDREAAVAAYQAMFDGCIACHDAYKDRVAAVLNETAG